MGWAYDEVHTQTDPGGVASEYRLHLAGYCVNKGVWFVSDVSTDRGDPAERPTQVRYEYGGARSDLLGRGWLGVSSRTETVFRSEPPNTPYVTTVMTFDNASRYGTVTLGHGYDYPFRNLVKTDLKRFHDAGGVQGREEQLSKNLTYDVVTSASVGLGTVGQSFSVGPVSYSEVLQEVTPPPNPAPTTIRSTDSPTRWTYDPHGNRTHEDLRDQLADGTTTLRTVDATFTQDEANWLIGQMQTRTIADQTPQGTAQRAWVFTPDSVTGLLNHVTYQPGVPDEQVDVDYASRRQPRPSQDHHEVHRNG